MSQTRDSMFCVRHTYFMVLPPTMKYTFPLEEPQRPLPMSTHLTNSPTVAAQSGKPAITQSIRPCTRCKAPIPNMQQFKMCSGCREKSRINSVKTAEKRKCETQTTVAHFKSSQAARVDELTRATNS